MPRERVSKKSFNVDTGEGKIEFLGKANAEGKRSVTNTLFFTAADFGVARDVYAKLSPVARHTIGNGAMQKLGDAYADSEDGTPFDNAKSLLEQVKAGTWATRGGGGERTSYLIRAMVELYDGKHKGFEKMEEAELREWLDSQSDEIRKALPGDASLAPIIARMKREDAEKREKEVAAAVKGADKTAPSPLAGLVKKSKAA